MHRPAPVPNRNRSRTLARAVLVTLAAAACAAPAVARADEVVITEEARTHFAAGVALLQDPKAPRYEEAYREFKAAYTASPSHKILGNLGLCAMKIERDGEAIEAYTKYLEQAGPELGAEAREQIKRDLLTLKSGSVEITVSSDPPGATFTDVREPVQGAPIRNVYASSVKPLTLRVRGGRHVVTARLAGYEDATWEFEGAGTNLPPHEFKLQLPVVAEQPVIRERPIPTAALVSAGVTVGLLGTGCVLGIVALQRHNEFTSLNDGTHVGAATDAHDSGGRLNTFADIFLAGALVGAGVTTYLYLTRPTIERRSDRAASSKDVPLLRAIAPFVTAHGGGGVTAQLSID